MSIWSITSILISFCVGMLIGRQARRERDERIKELEQKLKDYEQSYQV